MKLNQGLPHNIVAKLLELAKSGSTAQRHFMEGMASRGREPNAGSTEVDELEELGDARLEAVAFFKKLDAIGCGKFIAGRKKNKSRIEWKPFGAISVATAFLSDPQDLPALGLDATTLSAGSQLKSDEASEAEYFEHTFLLRRDLQTTIRLPLDLTTEEANRLAEFIRSLPF